MAGVGAARGAGVAGAVLFFPVEQNHGGWESHGAAE